MKNSFGVVLFEYFVSCFAFVRILRKLRIIAKSGASGNAEENKITKPNWIDNPRYSEFSVSVDVP